MSAAPTTERAHHRYSPSKLQSLEACPCYSNREDTVVHERTTAGTKAHAVTESGIDDNTLSDDDASAAAECLDFVEYHRQRMLADRRDAVDLERERLSNVDLGDDTAADVAEGSIAEVTEVKEAYLPIDDEVLPDGTRHTSAGYVDHCLIAHTGTLAKLFDWKFGKWPVEKASNNLQGIAYILGLAKRYPALETFEFFFKQPHLGTISDATFTRADLPALYLRVQVVVHRAVAAQEAIKRGDWSAARAFVPNCNFCGNLGRCPVVSQFSLKVGHKFYPLAIPDDITPTAIHSTRDTTLGLQLASVLGVWAKAFRSQITDRILRGEADVPAGHVLQTRSERKIEDQVKYKELAMQHVTAAQYDAACTVGFGAIEAAIRDKAPRGSKQAAVDAFSQTAEDIGAVVRGTPYTFLKAIADKE
jgi:hypothetical protein